MSKSSQGLSFRKKKDSGDVNIKFSQDQKRKEIKQKVVLTCELVTYLYTEIHIGSPTRVLFYIHTHIYVDF